MLKTIPFFGTCPARGELVLSSRCIVYAYWLRVISCRFPPGCSNLLRLRFLLADDGSVGTGVDVSGVSVLRENSDIDYLVGDGDTKVLQHHVERAEAGSFLKVHAINEDFADHGVDVQMTIEVSGQE
jgi:hypothetical protein